MKKFACWCCSLLLLMGCSKDMEEIIPEQEVPSFFLNGTLNGSPVQFDVNSEDLTVTGGV